MTATTEARISAAVSFAQRDRLERLARDQDRTISYLVRAAVGEYLDAAGAGLGAAAEDAGAAAGTPTPAAAPEIP